MKTAIRSIHVNPASSRKAFVAGSAAMLALAALVFAGQAEARDNVSLSIGVGVPLGVSSVYPAYPVYQQPVYVQPQVVYQEPAPVYYQQPRPVYYQQSRPVYLQPQVIYQQPQPIYYGRPHHGHHGGGYYVQGLRHGNGHGNGYNHGYARGAVPVYYGH